MSTAAPEFSRIYRIDTIGERPRTVEIEANEAERAALARRFGLISIARLAGSAAIAKAAGGVKASGHISASVEQNCVATGDAVPATIDEPFELKFVVPDNAPEPEEVELNVDELDIVEYDGQAVDLGEALAQTLALALDPFPRSPNADAILRKAGVISEEQAGPFGALAGLKDTLGGKG